jgi:PAS domain S-box-containing protein
LKGSITVENALTLLKRFCSFDFEERDCGKAVSVLSSDIHWFGTSDREDVHSRKEAVLYINDEIAKLPTPYRMTVINENFMPTGEGCGVGFLRINLENSDIKATFRITSTSKIEDGEERLCTMHFSVADNDQKSDEYFPMEAAKEKMAKAKEELVMSSMAGGLLGCYLAEGFPFYFVNDRLLEHLGYSDEPQFVRHISGLFNNIIHPDDRMGVYDSIIRQVSVRQQYEIDYRMLKKDGSVIWVHEVGRTTKDENGKEIIIAACYDITESHDKQAQLDNLVNALPGGVALLRMKSDESLDVLYQSRGVSELSGRKPEQYAALVSRGVRNSVSTEDGDIVVAALHKAAMSDETVSLDYRIPSAAGGSLWINGSFRRTGMEGGNPIIHAVFTEMPVIRNLMMNVTENANVAVVVSDDDTHELLYVNQEIFSILHKKDRNYEGQLCYRYLLGKNAPCPFCKSFNIGNEEKKELYIEELDRYYLTEGKLIDWAGRTAHVEYLTDITDKVLAQKGFTEMLRNVTCGILVSKTEIPSAKSVIHYMNPGFCRLFEDTEEHLRVRFKESLAVGFQDDDWPVFMRIKEEIAAGKKHTEGTIRYLFPGDRKKWIRLEVNMVLMPGEASTTTYSTFYDVTDQVQKEQQLRDVMRNVPGGICLYRWDGRKLHPIILSDQFSAMLGEDAMHRMGIVDGIAYPKVYPDDLQGLQSEIRKAFRNVQPIEYTYRTYNTKLREYRWLYMQAVPVRQADGSMLAYVSYTDVTSERLMAQSIKANERALTCATDEAGLWFWKYDMANNRAYFNERCRKDFGLPEVLDDYPSSWLDDDFLLPAYHKDYENALKKLKGGENQASFEAQIRFSDGIVHWGDFRFTNIADENGGKGLAVCTGRLIDDKKALQTKYEMERQKPTLGEKNLLFHAIFNLETGKTLDYGCVTSDSLSKEYQTYQDTMGHVGTHIIDEKSRKEFITLNDTDYLLEQLKKGATSFSIDYRRVVGQEALWVRSILHLVSDPNTKTPLLFEYCYDINEQRMAEEVLTASTIYDYERIASIDFQNGRMVSYGTSSGTTVYEDGRKEYASHMVRKQDRDQFLNDSAPDTVMGMVAEKGSWVFTTRVKRNDGTNGVMKSRFVPYDTGHKIYIMTRTDVTDLLKGEELKNSRLNDALAVAKQANAAKSSFLAAMSHDIRTPMNAIVGMCDLALDNEDDHAQVHESLKTIQSSSNLLLSLINNILEMSRIESGKMEGSSKPFSLKEEIERTTSSYKALADRKRQTFTVISDITHDRLVGDVGQIHRAVDNLLANAINYTPEGGSITYTAKELESGKKGIARYRFTIQDTGCGISKDKTAHLFEPFYRGDSPLTEKTNGTGLGLSITKAIVDLKGGTITIDSKEGKGTTVVMELPFPLAEEDAAPMEEASKPISSFDLSGVNVLLCEDHPVNQMVAKRLLEKVGATVTIANDGKEGLDTFLKSAPGTFSVILMDIRMPVMDGNASARAIRASTHPQAKTIPIIAMTANAFAEDVEKSRDAGMDEHLAKPLVPSVIYEAILKCIRKKQQE